MNTATTLVDDSASAAGTRFPRLSHAQWERTVQDLLHLPDDSGLTEAFAPDPTSRFDTDVAQRVVGPTQWTDYQTAAEALARRVAGDDTLRAGIVPSDLPTEPSARARAFIERFGARALRRPLQSDEVDRYAALFDQGPTLIGGDAFESGVELVLRAMLQSPHFLYRVEASTTLENGRIKLSGHELATRLSYAIWNTMPSDELLSAAAAGELSSPAGIESWAMRMLEDPRADDRVVAFHEQLFKIRGYGSVAKDPNRFPDFTSDLEGVLQQEATLYFEEIVVRRAGGIRELLTTPITHVNAATAGYYGVPGNYGDEMTLVDLDPTQRAGILTQLGFLSKNGGLVQSDPIHRGVFVNIDLLCADLAPPDILLPPLPAQEPDQTNRERIAGHTETCGATCHKQTINPIGFAFEHYDAIGQWRDTDNDIAVSSGASYEMDGNTYSYDGAIQLSTTLAETKRVHDCYASSWLQFMLGRRPVTSERALIDRLGQGSRDGDTARALLARITASDAFRTRAQEGT